MCFYESMIFNCAAASSNPVSDKHTYKRLESELTAPLFLHHFALQICTSTLAIALESALLWERILHNPIRLPGVSKHRNMRKKQVGVAQSFLESICAPEKGPAFAIFSPPFNMSCPRPCNYVVNAFYLCAAEALEPYRHLD